MVSRGEIAVRWRKISTLGFTDLLFAIYSKKARDMIRKNKSLGLKKCDSKLDMAELTFKMSSRYTEQVYQWKIETKCKECHRGITFLKHYMNIGDKRWFSFLIKVFYCTLLKSSSILVIRLRKIIDLQSIHWQITTFCDNRVQ